MTSVLDTGKTTLLCRKLDDYNVGYERVTHNETNVFCRNGDVLKVIESDDGSFGIVGMGTENAFKAAVFLS